MVFRDQRRSNQSVLREINPEYSLEGLMLKLKLQYFFSHDANNRHIGKDPDDGKGWGLKKKRVSEEEKAGWHHRFNGHEPGKTLGDGGRKGGLSYCSLWSQKESDITGWLNSNSNVYTCGSLPLLRYRASCDLQILLFLFLKKIGHIKCSPISWISDYLILGEKSEIKIRFT